MKQGHDKGEFAFAIMLCVIGMLPVTGLLSGIVYDDSIRESTGWLLFNIALLMLGIKMEWIFMKYTFRVYRREFNGIRDICRTTSSLWSELKKEMRNAR